MERMDLLYQKFCREEFDEKGVLCKFRPVVPENFNFAYDCVDYIAAHEPDRRAMVWCDDKGHERTFTFGEMSRYSNRTANYLMAHGVKKGDMVLVILKRHYEFWFTILALHKIGAVIIPATNLLTKKDIVYRVNAAGVSAVVCTADGEVSRAVEDAQAEMAAPLEKFLVHGSREGWHDFDKELEEYSPDLTRIPNKAGDPMLLYFSSGTTGYPKMVLHDHTYAIAHIITARHWHNVVPEGLHLTVADTGWGKAVWGKLYGQWLNEAAVFVYDFDRFHASDILPMFAKYHITTFCAPPTMYRMLIKDDLSRYDLSSIQHATIAGEALNPEVFLQFQKATGLSLMEGFGQSETTVMIGNLVGMRPKPGSMGKPVPLYPVDLVDPEGRSVPDGQVGEIVIRAEKTDICGLFRGYYNNPEGTDAAWHDGLYHTGDTAWRDEDGYFWYVGRVDDVIKSSGYRIGPFEIESVIMELPYVLECGVSAAPDEVRGQVVKASIVLIPGKEGSEELKKEIQDYVKQHTAPYKYPRIVEFKDALPKTVSGKIMRNKL